MHLLVAGDSNSFGSETRGDFSNDDPQSINLAYGHYLSKKLESTYENIALPGSSNIDIASKVIKWVHDNKDKVLETVIVIGWSDPGRLLLEDRQRIGLAVMNTYIDGDKLPKEIESVLDRLKIIDPTKEFFKVYTKYVLPSREGKLNDVFVRLFVDYYLTRFNAKYITFPTLPIPFFDLPFFNNLFSKKNNILYKESVQFKGITQPFEWTAMFGKYGLARGGHLRTIAHRFFAAWLYEEIKKREII